MLAFRQVDQETRVPRNENYLFLMNFFVSSKSKQHQNFRFLRKSRVVGLNKSNNFKNVFPFKKNLKTHILLKYLCTYFRQIIQENSVWSALNFFYVAVMYHIYKIWKTEYKTIKDSGYVLKGMLIYFSQDCSDKVVVKNK